MRAGSDERELENRSYRIVNPTKDSASLGQAVEPVVPQVHYVVTMDGCQGSITKTPPADSHA